jgi:uncharacterized protein YgbK (DUF1537 family)
MTTGAGDQPLVVLDDDPTGTQAVSDTPVLLEWDAQLVAETARGVRSLHLLTNSRAYPPERARAVVADAAAAAVGAGLRRFALRGDSTLRAHLAEEYLAVCDVVHGGRRPPLLLVPALPHAGRVTVGGIHTIERNGTRIPLHETEYARDPSFRYSDSRLIAWAEERSGGLFRRGDGREVQPDRVAEALLELQGRTAVVAPDAESLDDLETIAAGLRRAWEQSAEVVVRSAPTFVGVLAGTLARSRVTAPTTERLLVVCGSYVPATRRQLAAVVRRFRGSLVEVDVRALASDDPLPEVARAAGEIHTRLERDGVAVLATPSERPPETVSLEAGERIAHNLARVVRELEVGVVLAKGGITSAVTARVGLGARTAICRGPLVDGVALWDVGGVPFVVFPGNVGLDETLLEVVELIFAG